MSFSISSTPSATPPSSPELHFSPPAILLRSAAVRAAYLSLHDDDESLSSSPPPVMELPLNVYTGAPTDEECGLLPELDVALSNIDARSKPLVSWLRSAPAVTVVLGQTRRTMAKALAHYLNVRRAEDRASCVLLISSTDATAKVWQNALCPSLDNTLDINVSTFFMAKNARKATIKDLSALRRPGLIIASEKGLRLPEVKPGMSLLAEALERNPHDLKWVLVVSDIVRPDDLHDDLCPLRILANRQAEQAVVLVCKDDEKEKQGRKKKDNNVRDVVNKKVVGDFLRRQLIRFDEKDRDIETVWCTPNSLKERAASDSMKCENDGVRMDSGSKERDDADATVIPAKRERKGPKARSEEKDAEPAKTRLDPEMETELEKLRISAVAPSEELSRFNKLTPPGLGATSKNEQHSRLTEATPPDLEAKFRKIGGDLRTSTAVKSVPKRSRTFVSEDILRHPTVSLPSSVSGARRFLQNSSSVQALEDDGVIVLEDSDGEEREFYDAQPWPRTPPSAEKYDEDGRRNRSAHKRESRRRSAAEEKGNFPSSRVANGRRPPSVSSSTSPSVHVKKGPGAQKPLRRSRLEKVTLFDDGTTTAPSLLVRKTDNNTRRRAADGRRFSFGVDGATGPGSVKVKEEKEDQAIGLSKSLDPRVRSSDGRSSQGEHSRHTINGSLVERKDRSRKKYRRASITGNRIPVAPRGTKASGRPSSDRCRSPGPPSSPQLETDWPGSRSITTKERTSLIPRQTRTASNDDDIVVLDPPDEAHAEIDNEIWVISSDDDPKPTIRNNGKSSKDRLQNPTKINPRTQIRRQRRDTIGRAPSNSNVLTNVVKLRPDINNLPVEDRRKYNSLVARARDAEGKGPQGFSRALKLYLRGLDIYDGDDYLTSRILTLSTATNTCNLAELPTPHRVRPVSRSPIVKPKRKPKRKKISGSHSGRQSGDGQLSRSTNRVTNVPVVSERQRYFEGEVIVIDD